MGGVDDKLPGFPREDVAFRRLLLLQGVGSPLQHRLLQAAYLRQTVLVSDQILHIEVSVPVEVKYGSLHRHILLICLLENESPLPPDVFVGQLQSLPGGGRPQGKLHLAALRQLIPFRGGDLLENVRSEFQVLNEQFSPAVRLVAAHVHIAVPLLPLQGVHGSGESQIPVLPVIFRQPHGSALLLILRLQLHRRQGVVPVDGELDPGRILLIPRGRLLLQEIISSPLQLIRPDDAVLIGGVCPHQAVPVVKQLVDRPGHIRSRPILIFFREDRAPVASVLQLQLHGEILPVQGDVFSPAPVQVMSIRGFRLLQIVGPPLQIGDGESSRLVRLQVFGRERSILPAKGEDRPLQLPFRVGGILLYHPNLSRKPGILHTDAV